MSPSKLLGLILLLGASAIAGCGQDTIENTIVTPGGAIFGRISPPTAGTEVSAWQATKVKSTVVDAEGFFAIEDLRPGLYKVVVSAPNGGRRVIPDVAVDRTHSVSLGTIQVLALPTPLIDFGPDDGDSTVTVNSASVYLITSEPLDLRSLAAAVQFTPAIGGGWEYYGSSGNSYSYSFRPTVGLELSTTYKVHIGPSLRLESGNAWGATFDYGFRTELFRLVRSEWSRSPVLPPLYKGQLASLHFNGGVDPAAASNAIRIEPAVEFDVTPYSYSQGDLILSLRGALVPASSYIVIVDHSLSDTHGHALAANDSLEFSTERLRVTSSAFRGGPYDNTIPPGGDLVASLVLNGRIDIDSFNAAAAFDPPIAGFWFVTQINEGDYSPGVYLEFFPTGPSNLLPDRTFRFAVSGSADLGNGATLGTEFVTGFSVQPVAIMAVDPSNGSRSTYYSYVHVQFNTPMDQASTESAFVLERLDGVPVSGSFGWYTDGRSFQFSPTVSLLPSTSYRIRLATSARSMSGPTLKAAWSSVFRTQSS